jgi:hypothetical protein
MYTVEPVGASNVSYDTANIWRTNRYFHFILCPSVMCEGGMRQSSCII